MSADSSNYDHMEMETAKYLIKRRKYLEALSLLLKLKQRRVQYYWTAPIRVAGTIHTLCFGDVAGDPKDEIIIGTEEGEIYAIDIELDNDNPKIWVERMDRSVKGVQAGTTNLNKYDSILACSNNEYVYVLNKNGKILRNLVLAGEHITSLFISKQGKQEVGTISEIIIGSENNKIYVYDANLQNPLLPPIDTPSGINVLCSLNLSSHNGKMIIAGSMDGYIYAFDIHTGGNVPPRWQYETGGRIHALCAKDIDKDDVSEIIVGSEDGYVYVLDADGKLKWRYYTHKPVLDVDALDIDNNGHYEILLGVADGYMYVLNDEGEFRWRFKAGDQVQVVRAKDMNEDTKIEIVVGTDDQLTLLQAIDPEEINHEINFCFDQLKKKIQNFENPRSTIIELIRDKDEYIRAFALTRLAGQAAHTEEDFQLLSQAFEDPSPVVRLEMINVIVTLCNTTQKENLERVHQLVQSFLQQLATSLDQELLVTLVSRLHVLVKIDPEPCFEYLKLFIHHGDIWVRHAAIHQLLTLLESHPTQVWNLLLETIDDEHEWIRQEAAYALAHYFDIYINQLDSRMYDLLHQHIRLPIIRNIADAARKPLIRDTFTLLTVLYSPSIEEMRAPLLAYIKQASIPGIDPEAPATEALQIYQELYQLLHAPTIELLEKYRCTMDPGQVKGFPHFLRLAYVFKRLTEVVSNLQVHHMLKSEEQALFKAVNVIEEINRNIQQSIQLSLSYSESETSIAESIIFAALLKLWREEMQTNLHYGGGIARLALEIHETTRQKDELITFSVQIRNEGGVAYKVRVILEESDKADFALVNSNEYILEEISTALPAPSVQFTIRLLSDLPVSSVHLSFTIIFNDMKEGQPLFDGFKKGQDQRRRFVDKVDVSIVPHIIAEIFSPYTSGEPIKKKEMFFGRKREVQELQEILLQTDKVVIVSGLRRAGKTSLLLHLAQTIDNLNAYIPIYINLSFYKLKESQSEFLESIASSIHEQLKDKQHIVVPIPNLEDFEQSPLPTLQMFLADVVSMLGGRQLLLFIDEFMVIEELIGEEVLDNDFLQSFFTQRNQFGSIRFLLAGSPARYRPVTGYWSAFINDSNTTHHSLSSKIEPEDAQHLITNPVKSFLEFDPSAISAIQRLTNNQPYLIHIMCEEIIRLCNKQYKDFVNMNHVNIAKEIILKRGSTYLKWTREPLNQMERLLLSALAQEQNDESPVLFSANIKKRFDELDIPYDEEELLNALHNLVEDGIVDTQSDHLHFTIPAGLLREWLRREKPLEKVVREKFSQKLSF